MIESRPMPLRPGDSMVTQLVALGARYDAAPNFPTESLRVLAAAGLQRRFAPPASGGESFPSARDRAEQLEQALREVGRGDLSIGRLFEGHVNALLLFGWYANAQQQAWLRQVLDRGAWFGVWATEPPPGAELGSGPPYQLRGEKAFASGAGGLDFALITVARRGQDRQLAIIPANDRARADISGWRVRGMRASVSGRYCLDGLSVEEGNLLGQPGDYDRDPHFTAGAWRFCAVQLGGIEALLGETRRLMRDAARADPVQRARFAEAVVATRSAAFWVSEAARCADDEKNAVMSARLTRGVVENAGFTVMEAAARIIGTRSNFDGERVDKIIRDLSLYLRQAGPDNARDEAAKALLDTDLWYAGACPW